MPCSKLPKDLECVVQVIWWAQSYLRLPFVTILPDFVESDEKEYIVYSRIYIAYFTSQRHDLFIVTFPHLTKNGAILVWFDLTLLVFSYFEQNVFVKRLSDIGVKCNELSWFISCLIFLILATMAKLNDVYAVTLIFTYNFRTQMLL